MNESHRRPRVIAILGSPRSGSTLLERLVAARTAAVALGEVCYLWDRGAGDDQLCGCGRRFWSCEFWSDVMQRAYGDRAAVSGPAVATARDTALRSRHLRRILDGRTLSDASAVYADHLGRVLRAAASATDRAPLIDSSKHAPHVATLLRLARTAAVDLTVVHIVRDPRAVACSSQRRVLRPEVWSAPTFMPTYSPGSAARQWSIAQLASGFLRRRSRSVLIRYEDLVADPDAAIAAVASAAGIATRGPVADGHNRVDLATDHTVSGNPSRFRTGALALEVDDRWRRELSRRDRLLVTLLTLPLLPLYGYPLGLRPTTPGPSSPAG